MNQAPRSLKHCDVDQTIMDDNYFNFKHYMDLKLEDFGRPEEAFITYHGDIAFLRMTFVGAPYAMMFGMGQGPIGIKGTLVDRTRRLVVLRPDYGKVITNELLLAEYRCHEYGRGASFDKGLLSYAMISHRKIQNFPRNMAGLRRDYVHRSKTSHRSVLDID